MAKTLNPAERMYRYVQGYSDRETTTIQLSVAFMSVLQIDGFWAYELAKIIDAEAIHRQTQRPQGNFSQVYLTLLREIIKVTKGKINNQGLVRHFMALSKFSVVGLSVSQNLQIARRMQLSFPVEDQVSAEAIDYFYACFPMDLFDLLTNPGGWLPLFAQPGTMVELADIFMGYYHELGIRSVPNLWYASTAFTRRKIPIRLLDQFLARCGRDNLDLLGELMLDRQLVDQRILDAFRRQPSIVTSRTKAELIELLVHFRDDNPRELSLLRYVPHHRPGVGYVPPSPRTPSTSPSVISRPTPNRSQALQERGAHKRPMITGDEPEESVETATTTEVQHRDLGQMHLDLDLSGITEHLGSTEVELAQAALVHGLLRPGRSSSFRGNNRASLDGLHAFTRGRRRSSKANLRSALDALVRAGVVQAHTVGQTYSLHTSSEDPAAQSVLDQLRAMKP